MFMQFACSLDEQNEYVEQKAKPEKTAKSVRMVRMLVLIFVRLVFRSKLAYDIPFVLVSILADV